MQDACAIDTMLRQQETLCVICVQQKTKTAEGITKMLHVEYKLYKWVENMQDYLRSAMSYCGSFNLDEFIGKQTLIVNSPAEIAAVNK